ncbi:MAG: hypothetical protein N2C12_03355 [Planctomycetales bacterium]
MRVRFYSVVIGLCLGFTLKWALADLPSDTVTNTPVTSYVDTDPLSQARPVLQDPYAEPLVPPINIPGLTPIAQKQRISDNASTILNAFIHDPQASFHAHGSEVCASGCAASNHPTEQLTSEHFNYLLAQFATQPVDETSPAFEELLFYGRQTQSLIEQEGLGGLDRLRSSVLIAELQRTHAAVSIRLIDEHGIVRSHLNPTRVPLDRRHVFTMETHDLQPLVTSGTVKRVGLHHLWTRL